MLETTAAAESFRQTYGGEPLVFAQAPGRVNLIGEHIDYAGGWVLPMALKRGVTVAAAPGQPGRIRVHSDRFLDAGVAEFKPDQQPPAAFTRFVYALALETKINGADIAVVSDLPVERGWSSSAAFAVAVAASLLALNDREYYPQPLELCRMCQRAETRALGVECGLMDQYAALYGKTGHALWFDTRLEKHKYESIDLTDLVILLIDSGQDRALAESGYNDRRRELSQALEQLERRIGKFNSLLDLEPEQILDAAQELPLVSRLRLRHIATEHQRVERFVRQLKSGDAIQLGRLLSASHNSLSEDYDVSTPELDALCDTLTARPGIFGARLMGGGFGGSVLALANRHVLDGDLQSALASYTAETGLTTEWHAVSPGDGALVTHADGEIELVREWLP